MSKLVLLADDSATIRKVIELTFSDTDFHVEAVASGEEALARLEVMRPDIVLADVVMPEPSGYEICRRVKMSDRPIPVLRWAGVFEAFDPAPARACGADGCLLKPFESRALLDRVASLLASREAVGSGAVEPVPEEPSHDAASDVIRLDSSRTEPIRVPERISEEAEELASPTAAEVALPAADPAEDAALPIDSRTIDAIAQAVVRRLSDDVVRQIAREIVPRVAEELVRQRIRELENDET